MAGVEQGDHRKQRKPEFLGVLNSVLGFRFRVKSPDAWLMSSCFFSEFEVKGFLGV